LAGDNRRREVSFEPLAARHTVDLAKPPDRGNAAIDGLYEEAMAPILDDLGERTTRRGDDRSSAGERLHEHNSEWLIPLNRHDERGRFTKQLVLLRVIDLSYISNLIVELRRYLLTPVTALLARHRVVPGNE
jgi:hypothetical protein